MHQHYDYTPRTRATLHTEQESKEPELCSVCKSLENETTHLELIEADTVIEDSDFEFLTDYKYSTASCYYDYLRNLPPLVCPNGHITELTLLDVLRGDKPICTECLGVPLGQSSKLYWIHFEHPVHGRFWKIGYRQNSLKYTRYSDSYLRDLKLTILRQEELIGSFDFVWNAEQHIKNRYTEFKLDLVEFFRKKGGGGSECFRTNLVEHFDCKSLQEFVFSLE